MLCLCGFELCSHWVPLEAVLEICNYLQQQVKALQSAAGTSVSTMWLVEVQIWANSDNAIWVNLHVTLLENKEITNLHLKQYMKMCYVAMLKKLRDYRKLTEETQLLTFSKLLQSTLLPDFSPTHPQETRLHHNDLLLLSCSAHVIGEILETDMHWH